MSFKKPSVAASVAVYARTENAFLIIRRRHDPYKERYAFPGGYLDVDNEDLYQTAVRELAEETGLSVSPEELHLIDVRSSPKRDPRGHVIDVGFFCVVDTMRNVSSVTSEAFPSWTPAIDIDGLSFAFDHELFWSHIKAHVRDGLAGTGRESRA